MNGILGLAYNLALREVGNVHQDYVSVLVITAVALDLWVVSFFLVQLSRFVKNFKEMK